MDPYECESISHYCIPTFGRHPPPPTPLQPLHPQQWFTLLLYAIIFAEPEAVTRLWLMECVPAAASIELQWEDGGWVVPTGGRASRRD